MRVFGRHTIVAVLAFVGMGASASWFSRDARADEPVSAKEPRLLSETGENTTVIDAFDKDDPIDVNLLLTFRQQWKSANIRRETSLSQGNLSSGGFVSRNENVATYSQSTSILEVGGDIGLYKDLALSLRLPIVLSDSRELGDLDGSSANPQRLQDPAGEQLFTVPFKSPNRSGIDQIAVGLNYAIFNQMRDDTKPTWVIGAESRFAIGPRLHACNDNAPVKCPDPANPSVSRDPGISRGMTTLVAHTIFARRMGYVEPYIGFRVQVDLPQSNSDFGATSDVRGTLLSRPPTLGTFTIGTEVFPYENRETFQRFGLDFKVRGTYHSPGREYSELFDALGSSQAHSLRDPNPGAYHAAADGSFSSVADPNAAKVFFSGITDQQAFGSFGGAAAATWQAGEYVKFHLGVGLTYSQSHLVTSADACNPDLGTTDAGAAGPCRAGAASAGGGSATGIPNPNHRPVIDLPGRRFSVDDTVLVDLWLSGVVMF
ncbi:MAG: hypothetical protein JWO86_3162 [Myxococcaceae bacterium]|nr:hypothetical protein [Myxococcaceae bacterium]MEA2747427.1 hypothetical protein [Myxococcales bacterium]